MLASLARQIQEGLPSTWPVEVRRQPQLRGVASPDAFIRIAAPTGECATVAVEIKDHLDARSIAAALALARSFPADTVLLGAPFLSQRAREIIAGVGAGYGDATGNLRLQLDRPALFIRASGATSNPWPAGDEPLRTLKGPAAGRVVRALCEIRPPYGVRELAKLSGAPASTASRVTALLDREALIGRDGRSRITTVDWQNLLRRWTQDYSLIRSNRTGTYVEPRGLSALLKKLSGYRSTYSVTGSLAAVAKAPITAPRLGVVFVPDASMAADSLRLREAEDGANVMLVEPFEEVVFERTWQTDGVRYAGMAQVAADLLTGPGRGLSEGEEAIRWMEANEDAWRS